MNDIRRQGLAVLDAIGIKTHKVLWLISHGKDWWWGTRRVYKNGGGVIGVWAETDWTETDVVRAGAPELFPPPEEEPDCQEFKTLRDYLLKSGTLLCVTRTGVEQEW